MRQCDMSLPSPLPHQEQKKGLFKRPPPILLLPEISLFGSWYLCLPEPLERGTLGRDSPGARALGWVLGLALCPPSHG